VLRSPDSERLARSDTKEPLEAAPVEADDHFVVDGDHRNSHASRPGDQLLTGSGVFGDVLGRESDAPRRKKLFRRVTGLSRRGPVDRDRAIRHLMLP
jgi:hypothetical protein